MARRTSKVARNWPAFASFQISDKDRSPMLPNTWFSLEHEHSDNCFALKFHIERTQRFPTGTRASQDPLQQEVLDVFLSKTLFRMTPNFSVVSLLVFPAAVDGGKNLRGASLHHNWDIVLPGRGCRGGERPFRRTSDTRRGRQPPFQICALLS